MEAFHQGPSCRRHRAAGVWQNYHGPVVFTGGVDEDGNTLPLDAQQAERIREHVGLLTAL